MASVAAPNHKRIAFVPVDGKDPCHLSERMFLRGSHLDAELYFVHLWNFPVGLNHFDLRAAQSFEAIAELLGTHVRGSFLIRRSESSETQKCSWIELARICS